MINGEGIIEYNWASDFCCVYIGAGATFLSPFSDKTNQASQNH
jgi:hypothetical protein